MSSWKSSRKKLKEGVKASMLLQQNTGNWMDLQSLVRGAYWPFLSRLISLSLWFWCDLVFQWALTLIHLLFWCNIILSANTAIFHRNYTQNLPFFIYFLEKIDWMFSLIQLVILSFGWGIVSVGSKWLVPLTEPLLLYCSLVIWGQGCFYLVFWCWLLQNHLATFWN